MTENTFQYAKSDHPEVLSALRQTEESWGTFQEYVRKVGVDLTGEKHGAFYRGHRLTSASVVGVSAKLTSPEDLPGQWRKPSHNCRMPFKKNPIRGEWESNSHRATPIPGRREIEWGGDRVGPGAVFESEGFVYSAYGFIPRDPAPEGSEVWEEIKPSEWHAARERELEKVDEG